MTDFEIPTSGAVRLKQKLLEALQRETMHPQTAMRGKVVLSEAESRSVMLDAGNASLEDGKSVYSTLVESDEDGELSEGLREARDRLRSELAQVQEESVRAEAKNSDKTDFDDTLSMRGVVPQSETEFSHRPGAPSSSSQTDVVKLESVISGGSMADLSGYKDLSKAPMSFGDDDLPVSTIAPDHGFDRGPSQFTAPQFPQPEVPGGEVDTEFSGNVKTLIRLVNELPEGVTKQTGAQIIRLTMEAMGISMEDVLSEAQSAQSEMLDAVRANIKKIEEYKTVIRKLETDIKYYQGKANELSEIIDLFILSNTSGQRVTNPDDLHHH